MVRLFLPRCARWSRPAVEDGKPGTVFSLLGDTSMLNPSAKRNIQLGLDVASDVILVTSNLRTNPLKGPSVSYGLLERSS